MPIPSESPDRRLQLARQRVASALLRVSSSSSNSVSSTVSIENSPTASASASAASAASSASSSSRAADLNDEKVAVDSASDRIPASVPTPAPSASSPAPAPVKFERIVRLLEPGDEPAFVFNCARIDGLDRHSGIVIGCRRFLYVLDDFRLSDAGTLVDTHQDDAFESVKSHVSVGARTGSDGRVKLALRVEKLKAEKGQTMPTVRKESRCQKWSGFFFHLLFVIHNLCDKCLLLLLLLLLRAFNSIRELHKRMYQLQSVGVEFFHNDGTNFLLVFPDATQRNQAFEKITLQDLSADLKGK